ncbi:RNA 2',3'-cyclic phosphodiesterase, partial [Klebsiella pneumoniae]
LTLDDAGQWLRSRVVWLGTRQPPRGLLQLASMLRAQAARSGCYQSPQPFHPHITLWRDARRAVPIPAPGFRWTFPVNEFVLYESSFSRGRTRYTALERYPFDKES